LTADEVRNGHQLAGLAAAESGRPRGLTAEGGDGDMIYLIVRLFRLLKRRFSRPAP
jgi:hypothetical protein